MKRIIICLIALVAIGFAGCYIWFNLGHSEEKTLNVSYEEIVNNEHFKDIKFHKEYEYDEDKKTDYVGTLNSSDVDTTVTIRVDNSTQKVNAIYINCAPNDVDSALELYVRLSSIWVGVGRYSLTEDGVKDYDDSTYNGIVEVGLYTKALASIIDKNITDEAQDSIRNTIWPFTEGGVKDYDSFTYNGIEYTMSADSEYFISITPEI